VRICAEPDHSHLTSSDDPSPGRPLGQFAALRYGRSPGGTFVDPRYMSANVHPQPDRPGDQVRAVLNAGTDGAQDAILIERRRSLTVDLHTLSGSDARATEDQATN
jgi:hypothetical protein